MNDEDCDWVKVDGLKDDVYVSIGRFISRTVFIILVCNPYIIEDEFHFI